MGNTELKTAFKSALKDQPKEKLGLMAEIVFEDKLVSQIETFIKDKMNVTAIDTTKAFPESNIQVNENAEEVYKNLLINELNENQVTGFVQPQCLIDSFNEPGNIFLFLLILSLAYEKYFTVNSAESVAQYTKLQHSKFVILYALFVEKYKEQ